MKRYFVEYGILLVISVMARLMAGAGHPPPPMFVLAVYAAVLIWLSQERQAKMEADIQLKEAQKSLLRGRLANTKARVRRIETAFVSAATEAFWVSDVEIRGDKVAYVIDVPEHGRIVVHLPNEDAATKTDDASEASKEG